MIYIFDTNAIADLMSEQSVMVENVRSHQRKHVLGLCQPVDFEVQRGLFWRITTKKQEIYQERIRSQFEWISLADSDWVQAAHFWANARQTGQQLSDVDLLLASLAKRLEGIIISADTDFDALPIKRENWRISPQ